jgi:ferric-dicitrate binding protein FerR (iron transport regulator)
LLSSEDVTEDAAAIAQLWYEAREKHRAALVEREGLANFEGLQRFLACVHNLSADRRLSRYCYLAERVS